MLYLLFLLLSQYYTTFAISNTLNLLYNNMKKLSTLLFFIAFFLMFGVTISKWTDCVIRLITDI